MRYDVTVRVTLLLLLLLLLIVHNYPRGTGERKMLPC